MKEILLLDDSQAALALIGGIVEGLGAVALKCSTVPEAVAILQRKTPVLALVDLYLLGNHGAHLSNQFVRDYLMPLQIPYGRVTSAPSDLPDEFKGQFVYDKRLIIDDPQQFARELQISFEGLI
jgi:CheY-like chemotaxis protein